MSFLTDPNELDPKMIEWFNNNVLMGFTADRTKWATNNYAIKNADGTVLPWFANSDYDGAFEGPIPVEVVADRLFAWEAIKAQTFARIPTDDVSTATGIGDDGNPYKNVQLGTYAILRSDTDEELVSGVSAGFTPHQYKPWLLDEVANLLDDDLAIGSAGLLDRGGVAFVSVELPEVFLTPRAGFALRPRILAYTSHNKRFRTTYQRSNENPLCSNSFNIERTDTDSRVFKIKHTSRSELRIIDARQALDIMHTMTEEDVAFFDALAAWELNNKQFKQVLDILEPVPEPVTDSKGKVTNQRTINNADERRTDITRLYVKDFRAADWQGTALGVMQAFNTFDQQERTVNGVRFERQMISTLNGDVGKFDTAVLDAMAAVTDFDVRELVPA